MEDIAGARRGKDWGDWFLEGGTDCVHEVEEGDGFAAADVESVSSHGFDWRRGGEDIGLDHIVDINVITGLETIAEDDGVTPVAEIGGELGDNTRVGGVISLAGTKDIKIPERYGLKAI